MALLTACVLRVLSVIARLHRLVVCSPSLPHSRRFYTLLFFPRHVLVLTKFDSLQLTEHEGNAYNTSAASLELEGSHRVSWHMQEQT